MDINDRYKKDLEIIKNSITSIGGSRSEAVIAKKLGKGKTFFTDRGKNKKHFTKEDLIWLHYNYSQFLENPIVKNTEVEDNAGKKAGKGVNSDSRDQSPALFLEKLLKKQRDLADDIDSFLKEYKEHSSGSRSRVAKLKEKRQGLSPGNRSEEDTGRTGKAEQSP